MRDQKLLRLGCLVLILFLSILSDVEAEEKRQELIGKKNLNFNLASTQDRLLNYGDEYYKKHFLIITFFPAAFTPV